MPISAVAHMWRSEIYRCAILLPTGRPDGCVCLLRRTVRLDNGNVEEECLIWALKCPTVSARATQSRSMKPVSSVIRINCGNIDSTVRGTGIAGNSAFRVCCL